MKFLKRILLYFVALNMMGFGIALYLKTNLGVGAWDVLHSNLTEFFFNFKIGTWVFIVGIITVTVSQVFKINLKGYLAIISGLLLGQIMNLFYYYVLNFDLNNIVIQLALLLLSIISLGSGISLLVLTKLPPTPPDILMLSLVHRFDLNFTISKTIIEVSVLLVAILIGFSQGKPLNNVGIGTILVASFVGLVVGHSSKIWRKLLKL